MRCSGCSAEIRLPESRATVRIRNGRHAVQTEQPLPQREAGENPAAIEEVRSEVKVDEEQEHAAIEHDFSDQRTGGTAGRPSRNCQHDQTLERAEAHAYAGCKGELNVERSVVQREGRQKSDGDRRRKTCRKESCPRECKFAPDDLEVNEKHRCGGYQQNSAGSYYRPRRSHTRLDCPPETPDLRLRPSRHGRASHGNKRADEAAEEDSAAHRQEYGTHQAGCKARHGIFASLRDLGFVHRTRDTRSLPERNPAPR
ncbi:MAG: hypothetical protein JWP63_4427 [Candidatus Solibacter sp.]|nr:hypothetical protein [Candidatus Solibacter sp.]